MWPIIHAVRIVVYDIASIQMQRNRKDRKDKEELYDDAMYKKM